MEVLYTHDLSGIVLYGRFLYAVTILLMIYILVSTLVLVVRFHKSDTPRLIFYVAAFLFLVFLSFTISEKIEKDTHTEMHDVSITDFNVVYEKGYQVVKNKGDIYTVKRIGKSLTE